MGAMFMRPGRLSGGWRGAVFCALLAVTRPGVLPPAHAQQATETRPATAPAAEADADAAQLTPEVVADRLAQLEAARDLPDAVRAEATRLYRSALEQLKIAGEWAAKAAGYRKAQEDAPAQLQLVRQRLADAATRPASQPTGGTADAALAELAEQLAAAQENLSARQEAARKLEDDAKSRVERRAALPGLLSDADKRLQELDAGIGAAAPRGEATPVTGARQALRQAQKRAIEQELSAYGEELRAYTARADLAVARRELAARELAEAQAEVAALQALVSERRALEAQQQKRQIEEELQRAPRPARELAEENARLAAERADVGAQLDLATATIQKVTAESAQLRKELDELQAALSTVSTSDVLGGRIVQLWRKLDAMTDTERALRRSRQAAARADMRRAELADRRAELADLNAEAERALQEIRETEAADPVRLKPRVLELLRGRRELVEALERDLETHATELVRLQIELAKLLDSTNAARAFVSERGLWIRSTQPLTSMRWPADGAKVRAQAERLGQLLWADVRARPTIYTAAGACFLLLIALRLRGVRAVRAIAERVADIRTDSFGLTLQALGWAVLMSSTGTLALAFLAWRLTVVVDPADVAAYALARALRYGLYYAAIQWLILNTLRQIFRPAGLAETHFRWHARSVRVMRRNATLLTIVVVPVVLVTAAAFDYPGAWRDSIGRFALMAALLTDAVFLGRVLRPERGALALWLKERRTSRVYALRYVLYVVVVAIPLCVLALAALGYNYTALILSQRLNSRTFLLVLGLLVLHALLVRWLLLASRRVAIEQARRKRAALSEAERTAPLVDGAPAVPEAETEVDVGRLGDQTRRLLLSAAVFGLVVGLWLIWGSMLPALQFIGDVPLWSYTMNAAAAKIAYVTLADLVVALLVAAVTFGLARNVPGLIEIVILQRLRLDAGGRFAITTVARYLIVIVGVTMACAAIGIGWAQVQWLAAGMTVGLGFGLQEMFANFVSGLLLLFERPIRIGDTVTVGGITGVVTRIRIRATTIMDANRKELVVPNKEFITGQVVNWTLSDPMLRLVIPVGIAYGSDTDAAEALLLRIARESPQVLREPAPSVVFGRFGESSLDFELRVFIGSVSQERETRHHLHKSIDREFRRAGIEIPFPQRDVHIRPTES